MFLFYPLAYFCSMFEEKLPHVTDWLTVIALLSLALVAFFRSLYAKRFRAFLKLPLNSNYFSELSQEKEHPFWFIVFTESVLIIGITQFFFLLITTNRAQAFSYDPSLFFRILLLGLLFFTLQRFMHSLTGYLFNMRKSFTAFMQIKDGHLQWAAMILFAVNTMIIYGPFNPSVIVVFGIVLLSVLYVTGFVKASLIVGTQTLNPLQLFVYLCALEILPVFVLIKWLA